jgi:hypothetical protein
MYKNKFYCLVSFSAVLFWFLLVSGCGKKDSDNMVALDGGIKGGGTYIINETENIRSLDPVGINDVVSHHVAH